MHSWDVICIELADPDSDPCDCSDIDKIGYIAGSLSMKEVSVAAAMIRQGHSAYHVMHEGEEVMLKPAGDGRDSYVRALSEDSSDDPLLKLPLKKEYERQVGRGY